jgi:gliding motility-associated-like protein
MKKYISLLLILISSLSYSQQTIEVCDGIGVSKSYSIQSDLPVNLTWELNGTYLSNQSSVNITWDVPGVYEISVSGTTIGLDCPSNLVKLVVNVVNCDDLIYWVPNSFTPDDDEFNQSFKPVFYSGFDPFDYKISIYNRWGNLIWISNDYNIGWDGTKNGIKCSDGIYIWKIEFDIPDNDKRILEVGHIVLLK